MTARNFIPVLVFMLAAIILSFLLPWHSYAAEYEIAVIADTSKAAGFSNNIQGDIVCAKPAGFGWGGKARQQYSFYRIDCTDSQAKLFDDRVREKTGEDEGEPVYSTIAQQRYYLDLSSPVAAALTPGSVIDANSGLPDYVVDKYEDTMLLLSLKASARWDRAKDWLASVFSPQDAMALTTSRKMPTVYNTSTYGSAGRDYAALATWEAATDNNLVTAGKGEVLACYADSASYNDSVTMDGAACNASYFRVIMAAAGEGHGGVADTGFRLKITGELVATVIMIGLSEPYSSVYDIAFSSATTGAYSIYGINAAATGGNNRIDGLFIYDMVAGASVFGVYTNSASPLQAYNCLIEGVGFGFYSYNCGMELYNCTAYGCTYNYWSRDRVSPYADSIAKNCISEAAVTGSWHIGDGGGAWIKTTCTDDDGVTFVDAANNNFFLSEDDTAAINQGTDILAANLFNDDVAGTERPQGDAWDIGWYEYVGASASGRRIPFFLYYGM